jgi:hypothetical protein
MEIIRKGEKGFGDEFGSRKGRTVNSTSNVDCENPPVYLLASSIVFIRLELLNFLQ